MTDNRAHTRDPERRRKQILDAAAQLVAEGGTAALTHRAVAQRSQVALGTLTRHFPTIDGLRESALMVLSVENEAALEEARQALTAHDDDIAARCAQLMYDYLNESHQVQATMAQVTAATTDPNLRAISVRWLDQFAEILAAHMSPEAADAVATYFDGAVIHAAVRLKPVDVEVMTRVVRSLMTIPNQPNTSSTKSTETIATKDA